MIYVAILAAKLASPLIILFSLANGFISRSWRHLAIGTLVVAGLQEAALFQMQYARRFDVGIFLLGVAAAAIWSVAAFALSQWLVRRKSNGSSNIEK